MLRLFRQALLLSFINASALAFAEPVRQALVIGNKDYAPAIGALKNPINDAELIKTSLERRGFVVKMISNAKRRDILREIDDLARRVDGQGEGAISFVYYAGHGAANPADKENYLIPVEIPELSTDDTWYDAVSLSGLLGKLRQGAPRAFHFVVFDACRSELHTNTRATARGFEGVPQTNGLFVAYSTSPNTTASDVGESAGPYARALSAELEKPGLDHLNLFQNVKEHVVAWTKNQVPWESNGFLQRVYLNPPEAVSNSSKVPNKDKGLEDATDSQAWALIQFSTDPKMFARFIELYPASKKKTEAQARILALTPAAYKYNELDGPKLQGSATSSSPSPSPQSKPKSPVSKPDSGVRRKPTSASKDAAGSPARQPRVPKHYFVGPDNCLHRTLNGVTMNLPQITCEQSRFYTNSTISRPRRTYD